MTKVRGIGGIFFRSADPKALSAWYAQHLGLPEEVWGGAAFPFRVKDFDAPAPKVQVNLQSMISAQRDLGRG